MNIEITCVKCSNVLELISDDLDEGFDYECPRCKFIIIVVVKG